MREYSRELTPLMELRGHHVLTFFRENGPEVASMHWLSVNFCDVHVLLCEELVHSRVSSVVLAELGVLVE